MDLSKIEQNHRNLTNVIAVCIYHLVMISIDLSETTQKSALEIWDKFSLRQISDWENIREFFSRQNSFSDKFLFFWQLFFSTEFCLGLNFVSDYIPQLYFVCNLLIFLWIWQNVQFVWFVQSVSRKTRLMTIYEQVISVTSGLQW